MRSKKIISYLDTGIFNATIMFSCGFTYKEICSHLKKSKANRWLEAFGSYEHLFKNSAGFAIHEEIYNKKNDGSMKYYIIVLPKVFTFTDFEYVALAHEVLHICQWFLPCALKREKENECEAYLHSHIMNQCLRELRK